VYKVTAFRSYSAEFCRRKTENEKEMCPVYNKKRAELVNYSDMSCNDFRKFYYFCARALLMST